MQRSKITFITVLLFVLCLQANAKEESVTLKTDRKDVVTVQYYITERDGKSVVTFTNASIKPSMETMDKYRDYAKNMKVAFFDQAGGYKNRVVFTSDQGINFKPFSINRDELRYLRNTDDGYFVLEPNQPQQLEFEVQADQTVTLFIPFYLVYYKKSRQYQVLASCGNVEVKMNKTRRKEGNQPGQSQTQTRTVTMTEQVESEMDLPQSEIIKNILRNADEYIQQPNISIMELDNVIRQLIDSKSKISDGNIIQQINEKILACQERIKVLKSQESLESTNQITREMNRQQEVKAQQDLSYVEERLTKIDDLSDSDLGDLKATANELRKQSYIVKDPELARQMTQAADECDKKISEKEAGKKRRNIWLMVGGVLLAILMFVGNQTFQHFRNLKNQKGIEEMQRSIAKRAEGEAKRRVQSMARSKINKVQSEVRQKSRDAVRKGIDNAVKIKNKKGFSI